MSDAVLIAVISTIGAMIAGYMKFQGGRRESKLENEMSARSGILKEANKQRKAQGVFNDEVVDLLVRAERKMDHLTDMHERPDTAFATIGLVAKTEDLIVKVDALDAKTNGLITDIAVIKSKGGS